MQGTSWWHTNMGWRWGSENYICSLDKLHFPRENKYTRETRNTISSPVLWRNFTRTTTEISNRKEWDMSESYIWEKKRMSGTVQTYQHRTIMTGSEGEYSSSYTRCFPRGARHHRSVIQALPVLFVPFRSRFCTFNPWSVCFHYKHLNLSSIWKQNPMQKSTFHTNTFLTATCSADLISKPSADHNLSN